MNGGLLQLLNQYLAQPAVLNHIAHRIHLVIRSLQAQATKMAPVRHMHCMDWFGLVLQLWPTANGLEDGDTAGIEYRGAIIETRLPSG